MKNFARYNVLYGSIGTMILMMIWVNVNVYLLLFGNELNFALRRLRLEKLISDEMKKDIEDYHGVVEEEDIPLAHKILVEQKEKENFDKLS